MKNESVLDQPKKDLDSTVWQKTEKGYELTEEASTKIGAVAQWVIERTGLINCTLHITGSITSNQYSDKSDIDLHFYSPDVKSEDVEKLNKTVRKTFDDEYKSENPEQTKIGTHVIEIYFQENQFQDMMSIGCYDFFKKEWIVGPELLPQGYDPYSEYYNEDMKYVNSVIEDIRNVILEVYEILIVLSNSTDEEFRKYEFTSLKDKLAKAATIFTQAREFRKVYSSPKSMEDALSKRSSRQWKVADSAFKLLDKFGYLGILCELTKSWEEIQAGQTPVEVTVPRIIDVIQNNIMKNPDLQNVDKELFESLQKEGMGKTLALIATIASMISVPELTNASTLKRELRNIPEKNFNINDPMVTKAINKSTKDNKMIGKWSFANLTNLLATIAYNEGMLDYIKKNGKGEKFDDRILQAILWTIITRAGGDPKLYADACLAPEQYYSSKHVKEKDPKKYVMYHPGVGYSKKTWDKCNEFAVMAINGTLPMPKDDNGVEFGRRNMIANKKKDNPRSFEEWGKKCDFTLGGQTLHTYGYDPAHDGFRSKTQIAKTDTNRAYKIQSGDTLIQIAKKFNTTPDDIMKKNPSIKKAGQIYVGKTILV